MENFSLKPQNSEDPGAGSVPQAQFLAALARVRQLPAGSPAVRRAIALLNRPDFELDAIKKTLMSDAAVCARILRLANSAYFGFRCEVRTISQAIVLMGQQRVRTLLFRIVADKIWSELGDTAAAQPVREISLVTATAACSLAQLLFRDDSEEILLAGLLHNRSEELV